MYNWSPVPFDFLLHTFYSSGKIPLFSRKQQISSAVIPVDIFYVKGRNVMERQLLASFPFYLSFCITTVLPLVIHRVVSPSRNALRCKVFLFSWVFLFSRFPRFLCKLVKFFSQNLQSPSGPGSFRFGISLYLLQFLYCAGLLFPFISFLISLKHVASLLWSTFWPQISVQNGFLS